MDDFPELLPANERVRWNGLTAAQRKKARDRIEAFEGWELGDITLAKAIENANLSKSRFYRLAADWRDSPSLEALGALAGAGVKSRERLKPDVVNRLQAHVAEVVALNGDASVAYLARELVKAAGLTEAEMPGMLTIRTIVETEQRRVMASGEAGTDVCVDVTAINLPQADGRPWIMFSCLDKGTGLVIGAAVSTSPQTCPGYADMARDALTRISGELRMAPWSLRMQRAQFAAGVDVAATLAIRNRLLPGGVEANVQIAQKRNRFGAYFRTIVGGRMGRIAITPARTETGDAMPDNGDMTPWSQEAAASVLGTTVTAYNEALLERLRTTRPRRIPDDLTTSLRIVMSS